MDTYISDFSKYVLYLKEIIENTTIALQDNNEIPNDSIEYVIFDNYGEYNEEKEKVRLEEDTTPILVCIRNDGGVVDTAASISTYLQSTSLEIMAPVEKSDVVAKVFNTISLEYSKKVTTVDNKPTLMLISDLPEYSTQRQDVLAKERFTIKIRCDFVVYEHSILADQTEIYINDVKLPFKSWSIASVDELEADNKFGYEDNRVRYLFNASTFILKLEYFYQSNNAACLLLNNNALTNGNFGQSYNIKIKYSNVLMAEYTVTHKTTTVSASNGSLLMLTTEFYLYSTTNSKVSED